MKMRAAKLWEGLYTPTPSVRRSPSGHKAPPTGFENTPYAVQAEFAGGAGWPAGGGQALVRLWRINTLVEAITEV